MLRQLLSHFYSPTSYMARISPAPSSAVSVASDSAYVAEVPAGVDMVPVDADFRADVSYKRRWCVPNLLSLDVTVSLTWSSRAAYTQIRKMGRPPRSLPPYRSPHATIRRPPFL